MYTVLWFLFYRGGIMKKIMLFEVLLLLAAAFGCATSSRVAPDQKKSETKFEIITSSHASALQKRTEAFTQGMVRSFQTGDFSHWKNLVEKEGEPGKPLVVDEAKFHAMRQRLEKHWGKFVKCSYLGSLDQSVFRDYIWKCTFESQTDSGTPIRLEELFVVRCTFLNGKATFAGFGFRFFNRPGFRDQVLKIKKAEVKK